MLLLTGFPGFIGSRLVRSLLDADDRACVVALVERRFADAAREAAAEIDERRIEVLPGDITEPFLDLAEGDYERLLAEVRSVFHLAAIYDLAVPYDVAQRVNVEGTGNVVELCERAERLERLNYISTAYVAGDRTGVVYEHELSLGQGFKNHYEATKFQAEVWVRSAMGRVPTTIIRPAIVVGDSRTGETAKFDGPYYFLRLIALAQRLRVAVPQVGSGDAPLNVVPVDFVVGAITASAGDRQAVGETLHLVDPAPATAAEMLRLLSREYAGREPGPRVPAMLSRESLRLPAVRRLVAGMPRESMAYVDHPVRFDVRRAAEILGRHALEPPPVSDYVGALVDFYRRNEDDPACSP